MLIVVTLISLVTALKKARGTTPLCFGVKSFSILFFFQEQYETSGAVLSRQIHFSKTEITLGVAGWGAEEKDALEMQRP